MRKITLVCFGKLKFPGMMEAVSEFEKRLSRYVDFEVIELKPVKSAQKSESERKLIQDKEASVVEELLKNKRGAVWCLSETGRSLKALEWAEAFNQITDHGPGELILIIGGSLGISEKLLKQSSKTISLGPQTLSHELARLVLVEQLYRTLSQLAGHPYHNEG